MITRIAAVLIIWVAALSARLDRAAVARRDQDGERGDVPGWVMITVMTAIVVIALLAVFKQQVLDAVNSAFTKVTGAG